MHPRIQVPRASTLMLFTTARGSQREPQCNLQRELRVATVTREAPT